MQPHRCLTICMPWPYAIFHLGKNLENRPWSTGYRGPLLIHVGKSTKYWKQGIDDLWEMFYSGWIRPEPDEDEACNHAGMIIGMVDMVGVKPFSDCRENPWACGPFCHEYENPRLFREPIPYRGAQGFFFVPDEVVREAIDEANRVIKR